MNAAPSPTLSAEQILQAFAVNALAIDAVVVELVLVERDLVARVRADGVAGVRGVDTTDLALQLAGPRMEALVRMHERLARSVRLTLALQRRIETGWPRRGEADDRRAMARRQVERAVGARIRAEFDEPAERLLEELQERLWDPAFEAMLDTMPVGAVIAAVGDEFAAVRGAVAGWVPAAMPEDAGGEVGRGAVVGRRWPAGLVNPPPDEVAAWRPGVDGRGGGARAGPGG